MNYFWDYFVDQKNWDTEKQEVFPSPTASKWWNQDLHFGSLSLEPRNLPLYHKASQQKYLHEISQM